MNYIRRLPWLFYSYLATEMLAPIFAMFMIMNGVMFLAKLIPFLNVVLELNISLADFVRLSSYLFPKLFLFSLPLASLLGIIIGFSRLTNDSEMLAFKASGISIYHTIPPLVLVSAFVAMITAYSSIVLNPASERAMRQMMFQLAKEKIDKGIKEQVFTEALGELVVHVMEIDKKTGAWQKVWVSDMRNRQLPVITMANSGTMETKLDDMLVTLTLHNGSLHMVDRLNVQIVNFERYLINIPLKPPTRGASFKSYRTMSLAELKAEYHAFDKQTRHGRSFLIEYHKKLVLPAGCIILSLLGMPLGLQARPGRKAIGIPLGIFCYLLYYIFFTVSRNLAFDSLLPIPPVMWSCNVIFLGLAMALIYRSAREQKLVSPVVSHYLDRTKKFFQNIFLLITSLVLSLSSRNRVEPATSAAGATFRQTQNKLRGNVKSRVFHFSECDHYHCENCSIEFKDVEIALQAGFEPCRFCQDLMPAQTRGRRPGSPQDTTHSQEDTI